MYQHRFHRPVHPVRPVPALHTIYRSSPGENLKGRPVFYSKDVALASFVRAAGRGGSGSRIFVNDGFIGGLRGHLQQCTGEIVQLHGAGNARSYRACVALAESRNWDDEDLVYFVEDDYLHAPEALLALRMAAEAIPEADYLTLYDHPDYYALDRHRYWIPRFGSETSVGDQSWRRVRSTCLTYAARVGAIRRDSWLHYLCSRDGSTPSDYVLWSTLQSYGPDLLGLRLLKRPVRPSARALLGAVVRRHPKAARPRLYGIKRGLAGHLEEGMLGPDLDWMSLADETYAWLRSEGASR